MPSSPIVRALVLALACVAPGVNVATAQGLPPAPAGEAEHASLSPECRVPGSRLHTLAALKGVKAALKAKRTIRVLAIGSSSTVGIGASSPPKTYPGRLEGELERLFPAIDVEVVNRGINGERADGQARRMLDTVEETSPDLVVWQVGTNDALAGIDADTVSALVQMTAEALRARKVDLVLVDPQYTEQLGRNPHYGRIVAAVGEAARRGRVPLVRRYDAMRVLDGEHGGRAYLSPDQLHLNDLGYRCMAEHVARAIALSLLEDDEPRAHRTAAQ